MVGSFPGHRNIFLNILSDEDMFLTAIYYVIQITKN